MNDEEAALLMAALAAVESDIEAEEPPFLDKVEPFPDKVEPIHVPFPVDRHAFRDDDATFYSNLELLFPPAPQWELRLTTTFLPRYWKNGRKNLQCFPFCPEYHDFYDMKMQNKKHASVGVCRTPVHCTVLAPPTSPLVVLARFEQISPGRPAAVPPTFAHADAFALFQNDCFQATEVEAKRECVHGNLLASTWMFLPDVWKVQPLLRKKRKATRSGPAQTFPFYFRVYVYARDGLGGYRCYATGQSPAFELFSTRTVDRLKKTTGAKA
ncbi:hypothetical protein ACHHYP_09684 [Achlya hypogyna]|uniref:Uncharacterized protein n=1 Tax=Achlya hypogyna TaxID=1202772 RepID=A0A1V9YML2_ACHHY|nr:hypothetical protein ACHHYP_09684 [Achlya hypogyna]